MSKRAEPCPCGRVSQAAPGARGGAVAVLAYDACCGPCHRGEREAADAEALMRSRYAAFVKGELAYLWRTLHPDHEDRAAPEAACLASLAETCARHRFAGLRVLEHRGPDADGLAEVRFVARVFERKSGRDVSFVERSVFAHDGVGWRYLYGEPAPFTEAGSPR